MKRIRKWNNIMDLLRVQEGQEGEQILIIAEQSIYRSKSVIPNHPMVMFCEVAFNGLKNGRLCNCGS